MAITHHCYLSGVKIRTANGDVAVETIKAGDMVVVLRNGQEVLEPAKWVGHKAITLSNHAHVEDAAPIRIRAGAIAEGQPARDLCVSPEHNMILDGRCVPARLLVNGGSIVSERDHAPFLYHHIELESHGILLAENTPSESYLDSDNRAFFDNSDMPTQLFPRMAARQDGSRQDENACAPSANPERIKAIWTSLAERSVTIGFPIPDVVTDADADVRIVADGVVIAPTSEQASRYVFIVPAGVASVTLASRFCIPSDEMLASQRDTRRLGVSVNWIAIRSDNAEIIISADNPALMDGWHAPESEAKSIWRWTNGAATIPWGNVAGPAILTVCCNPADRYPLYDAQARLIA